MLLQRWGKVKYKCRTENAEYWKLNTARLVTETNVFFFEKFRNRFAVLKCLEVAVSFGPQQTGLLSATCTARPCRGMQSRFPTRRSDPIPCPSQLFLRQFVAPTLTGSLSPVAKLARFQNFFWFIFKTGFWFTFQGRAAKFLFQKVIGRVLIGGEWPLPHATTHGDSSWT